MPARQRSAALALTAVAALISLGFAGISEANAAAVRQTSTASTVACPMCWTGSSVLAAG